MTQRITWTDDVTFGLVEKTPIQHFSEEYNKFKCC